MLSGERIKAQAPLGLRPREINCAIEMLRSMQSGEKRLDVLRAIGVPRVYQNVVIEKVAS